MFKKFYIILFYGGFCCAQWQNDENDYGRRFNLLPALGNFEQRDEMNERDLGSTEEKFDENKPWTGRWFPNNQEEDSPRMIMGKHPHCDDGKTNLQVDWNNSPENYTCYKTTIEPSYLIKPKIYCEYIPKFYFDAHLCMNETIEYDDIIPTYGTHRPVWPVYGEYKFLPRQRWLHSIEHGAVVMLYHPCANPLEVDRLKKLVKNCLRRHIITPYNLLDTELPLALVARGCRLTMSYVNENIVTKFITEKALRGPEAVPEDGDFNEGLVEKAKINLDESIDTLCSKF